MILQITAIKPVFHFIFLLTSFHFAAEETSPAALELKIFKITSLAKYFAAAKRKDEMEKGITVFESTRCDLGLKALVHSSQKPTRKLAARTFIQSQYLKALAASLRVSFCDAWKRGLRLIVFTSLLCRTFVAPNAIQTIDSEMSHL